MNSGSPTISAPPVRLEALSLSTARRKILARGDIHQVTVYQDGRRIAYRSEDLGVEGQTFQFYWNATSDPKKIFDAVQWGTKEHVIDSTSAVQLPVPFTGSRSPSRTVPAQSPGPPDARLLSTAPIGSGRIYLSNTDSGSRLQLCGGRGQSDDECSEFWHGKEWIQEIQQGMAEPIHFLSADGVDLIAWLLLPPSLEPQNGKLSMVTIVCPGTMYTSSVPAAFSVHRPDFLHPQLFAAMGYAVLLPSMPEPNKANTNNPLSSLLSGVLPAVDAVIARGIVNAGRIAVAGNSAGGFATLGLISQTTRFRTAVASASYCDLTSLYGTFYGQYRHGDAGHPLKGQALRMLQLERGVFQLGGPPWKIPERYHMASPVLQAQKIQTPLFLIHGDLDFIPIQQAEEFFTALYRQDKRVSFARYQGEGHGIANRANVLDLWRRLEDWLSTTLQ